MEYIWNPWHGCHKISSGCLNCYVYRRDSSFLKDSSVVTINKDFDLPIRKNKKGDYKIPSGSFIYTCLTSDFFLPDADSFRIKAWDIIRTRNDCTFYIITKRIDRFNVNLPNDFINFSNVIICCTIENQEMADYRLPIFKNLNIEHKEIICEPLLSSIDLSKYLDSTIEKVTVGGESGPNARLCDYNWVLNIRSCCIKYNVKFHFKQTGANFKKNDKIYNVERKYQLNQARKANIDT